MFVELAGAALAAACCGGGATAVPSRPADCDRVVAGVGVSAQASLGVWDGEGKSSASSAGEQAVIATVAAGYRPARWGFATLQLPALLNRHTAGEDETWGGGVGDVRAMLWTDPVEEKAQGWAPVPFVGVGVRGATGRAWDESDDPLLADVTGEAGTALLASASMERGLGHWPYGVALDVEIPVEDRLGIAPAKGTATVFAGHTLGDKWSLTASLRHVRTFPPDGEGAAHTAAALKLVRGERLLYRAWIGVDADLPVGGLGRSFTQLASVGGGVVIVR